MEPTTTIVIEGPEHLEKQQEFVRTWNELVYSGAIDHKGTQAQFMASMFGGHNRG